MIQLYGSLRDHLFWAVCTLALPVYGLAQRIADGAARIGATLFGELLNAVFANVGQRAIRKVARETFDHLLNLDLKFHLSRQTGGLTRAIDRGTKYAAESFSSHSISHKNTEGSLLFFRPSFSALCLLHLRFPSFVVYWCLLPFRSRLYEEC